MNHIDEVPPIGVLRQPPWSEPAEQNVLGALLLDNMAFDKVSDIVTAADFYSRQHRLIYSAIAELVMASKAADVVTVFERLKLSGTADECGGLQYLNALFQAVPGAGNARRLAEIIAERSMMRALIAACDSAATSAFNPQGRSAVAIIDAHAAALNALERKQMRREPVQIGSLIRKRVGHINDLHDGTAKSGMPTGIGRLDRLLTGGLRPGGMYVLAARPSVGKSSLAQAIALYCAGNQCPVLMLSQEMPDTEVAERAMSNLGSVDYEAIQTGALKDPEWNGLIEAFEASEHMPLFVDDQGSLTLADIRAKARQVKGLKLLVLDYLQLSAGDGDNRNAEIEQISHGLKSQAKEMGFAVLALSQLNRKVEERASKEPLLSDLRDSGAIEQDADVVMFLWPAVEYRGGSKLVGIKLEKNRQGKKGRFGLDFDGAHQRWVESTQELPMPIAPGKGKFE